MTFDILWFSVLTIDGLNITIYRLNNFKSRFIFHSRLRNAFLTVVATRVPRMVDFRNYPFGQPSTRWVTFALQRNRTSLNFTLCKEFFYPYTLKIFLLPTEILN